MVAADAAALLEPELDSSDPSLIALVRAGDADAYGLLYARHVGAALRLARVLSNNPSDVDDLVAEAFAKVLATLRAGGGPDTAFRAYLLTTLRHVRYDRSRRERRIELTDDVTRYETVEPLDDPTISRLEGSYAARAFNRLPERWRAVLWHTEVEGESPAQVAPLLGLTPNGVAALAYRARERLRQMYLQEHISLTSAPRCHWTGEHLAGFIRASLARRDRTKVEDHLAECAECRRLHRELSEENAGFRGVLAAVLLGAAAPGYLASAGKFANACWLAGLGTGLAAGWTSLIDWLGAAVGWFVKLPATIIARYGAPNVAAAGGVVVAATMGVVVFATVLVHDSRSGPSTALPMPTPAQQQPHPQLPHELPPLAIATSAPMPDELASPRPSRPGQPTRTAPGTSRPPVPAPSAGAEAPAAPSIPLDLDQVSLTAGRTGVMSIPVRVAGSGTPAPSATAPTAALSAGALSAADWVSMAARQLVLDIVLPVGMALAAPDAGDGWTCAAGPPTGSTTGPPAGPPTHAATTSAGSDVRCQQTLAAGTRSRLESVARDTTARLAVSVAPTLSGFQPVAVRVDDGRRQTRVTLRVPVAPAGLTVAHAATGRVGLALAGNALLSCLPRPGCLERDNNVSIMVPLLPGVGEPAPPGGLTNDGPAGPDGPITVLAGPKAASGARLDLPPGARVRWAGLVLTVSGPVPAPLVALRGPAMGSWQPVALTTPPITAGQAVNQSFADVTAQVSAAGAGDWWLTIGAGRLPGGLDRFAGWSLAVSYQTDAQPDAELAVYLGPASMRSGQQLDVALGSPRQVRAGLLLWDGDRKLTGDNLRLAGVVAGDPDNLAGGQSPSAAAAMCRDLSRCAWRTPGMDLLQFAAEPAGGGALTLRSGADPLEVGLIGVVTSAR